MSFTTMKSVPNQKAAKPMVFVEDSDIWNVLAVSSRRWARMDFSGSFSAVSSIGSLVTFSTSTAGAVEAGEVAAEVAGAAGAFCGFISCGFTSVGASGGGLGAVFATVFDGVFGGV